MLRSNLDLGGVVPNHVLPVHLCTTDASRNLRQNVFVANMHHRIMPDLKLWAQHQYVNLIIHHLNQICVK